MDYEKYLNEASSSDALPRYNELVMIMKSGELAGKLKDAHMKTQKEAAKIFQQAISLLKGLK
jgi:hypothetical protein